MNATRVALDVRTYRDDDQEAVLGLLGAALGVGPAGERSPGFFRWKHLENPFGRSFMLVAAHEGRIVGFRSFMRWRFTLAGAPVTAVRAVDTATHPDHQGQGIFRTLTLDALDRLRADTDLVFNTPNDQSRPGYLKMGWRPVGEVPIRIRVRRPVRFARGLRSRHDLEATRETQPLGVGAMAAADVDDWEEIASLPGAPSHRRLTTATDEAYLRWRYADAPLLGYRVVVHRQGGQISGAGVFRVRLRGRLWETTVADLIHGPGDRREASWLLGAVARAARVDHVTASLPPGSDAAAVALRRGYVPSPERPLMVANPLRPIAADPFDPGAWALTLGDIEVF